MNLSAIFQRNIVAAFVSVVFVAPVLWMVMDRDRPYDWIEGKIHPNNPKPGDWLEVEWKVKINRVCDGWVQREIVLRDGSILNYDPTPAIRRDQLSGDKLYRSFPLSSRAIPGPARYRAYTCYVCNPLQTWWPICVRTPEINFEIRAP